MPDVTIDVLTPGDGQGDEEMPEGNGSATPIMEAGNQQVALTAMANGFAAAATRRTDRADQLSGDSQAMWGIAMTTPTVLAGLGYRAATESGAGRTRVEANRPTETSAAS